LKKNTKEKIYIVFGLHAYQPPTQTKEIVKKINWESYRSVSETILEAPDSTIICADINLSLLELLEQCEEQNTINLFKNCHRLGKMHLVNTAAYHPILPLVPEYYIKRQLEKNLKGYQKYFEINPNNIKGIFPPEMAFSERILKPIREISSNQWLIVDDTTFCIHYRHTPPYDKIIKRNGVYIFLMSHLWHKAIAFGEIEEGRRFLDALKIGFKNWVNDNPAYLILWMDWETFGHHDRKTNPPQNRIKNFLKPFFKEIAESDCFELTLPDKLIELFPEINIFVPDGSWSTSSEDYLKNIPWPLWLHPYYTFHQRWWELANFTLSIFGESNNPEIEDLIDKALYSCQVWQWSHGNKDIAKRGLEIFKKIFEHPTTSAGIRAQGLRLIREIQQL